MPIKLRFQPTTAQPSEPEEEKRGIRVKYVAPALRGGVLPTVVRVGSGFLGFTPWTGAASGAIGEVLAQMIEKGTVNPKELDPKRIGAEAVVGGTMGKFAKNLSNIVKYGKKGLAAAQGAIFGGTAPIIRHGVEEGDWNPLNYPAETALGVGLGAGGGYGAARFLGPKSIPDDVVAPVVEATVTPADMFKGAAGLEKAFKLLTGRKASEPVTPEVKAAYEALVKEQARNPTGQIASRIGPPLEKMGVDAQGQVIWKPPSLADFAKMQEEGAGVITKSTVATEKAYAAAMKEKVDAAKAQEAAAKLVSKEKVDAAKTQTKFVEDEAKRAAANLNAKDKFGRSVAKAQEQASVEYAKRQAEAVRQLDDARQAEAVERLRETFTELKPPSSISETVTGPGELGGKAKATFRRTLPEPLEGAAAPELPPLGPAAGGFVPAATTKLDPAGVASNMFRTEKEALQALGLTGKTGVVERIGKGKWRVRFLGEEPPVAPRGPEVEPLTVPTPEAPPPVPEPPPAAPTAPRTPKPKGPRGKAGAAAIPAVKAFKGPKAETPVAANVAEQAKPAGYSDSYEKMVVESSLPPNTVKIDLTGAQNAAEVKNRVLNELYKYKQAVAKALADRGVDAKGAYTYPTPMPDTLSVHVPGGPTYRINPDQVDNAIARLEKGLSNRGAVDPTRGAGAKIDPNEAFRGIVDPVKPVTEAKISVQGAPSYKLSIAPIVKPKTPTGGDFGPRTVGAAQKPLAALAADEATAWNNYWKLKEAAKTGQATPEDVKAAGEAAGHVRALVTQAAKAAKEAGEPIPLSVKARLWPEEVNSDEIAQLPVEEQKRLLALLYKKFGKGKKGGTTLGMGLGAFEEALEAAQKNPQFAAKLIGGAGGAATGALLNEEDPLEGAVIGGMAGLGGGAMLGKKLANIADIKDLIDPIAVRAPNYYRAGLLSHPVNLMHNSIFGPLGSQTWGGLEQFLKGAINKDVTQRESGAAALKSAANLPKWLKDFWGPRRAEAAQRITDVEEVGRAGRFIDPENPNIADRLAKAPATVMLAGDLTAKYNLAEAGMADDLVDEITLTAEPVRALTKWLNHIGKTKSGKTGEGEYTNLGRLMLPFVRTAANIIESGTRRTPVLGSFINYVGDKTLRIPAGEQLVEQGLGLAAWSAGFALGSSVDKDTAKALKLHGLASNLGGQYALLTGTGYLAGQMYREGKPIEEAAVDSFKQNYMSAQGEMPLPTMEPLQDVGRSISKFLEKDYDTLGELVPRTMVPRMFDAAQEFSDLVKAKPKI